MTRKENIYNQIKTSGNLPALPDILLKLLEACDSDTTPLSEIASLISKDPALSARILQLVNSSYYGLRSSYTGVEQAAVYLGVNSLKSIALITSVHQVFAGKHYKARQFDIGTFWWHSLVCATLAKRIARKTGFGSLDEAYLSGLLLDVGRLVLVSTFPKEYERILFQTEDKQNEPLLETQLIGINHCEAGSWLVNTWKMNSLMADAIRFHHGPLEKVAEGFPLIKIAYLANVLREINQDFESACEVSELLLGLDISDLRDIVDGATGEVLQIARDLNIGAQPPLSAEEDRQKTIPSGNSNQVFAEKDIPNGKSPSEDHDTGIEVQSALAERIKSITLLSGILEDLVQAGDSEAIIAVFEKSMSILFDITKVLFFLPDREGLILRGFTSASNNLQHLGRGLILPVQQITSLIVKAYLSSSLIYLTTENKMENPADEQVYEVFRCAAILLVPLIADKKPTGVILLGLPESAKILSETDSRLVRTITQQVGLCLHLERMKIRKAEELEAERMAAISMTARKFAHEVNNPLGIITNYLTAMGLKFSGDNEVQEDLRVVGEEINRISSMFQHMDMFSQTAVTTFESADVNEIIRDIIHIVKMPLFVASGKDIAFNPDAMLPQIVTSRDALKQIMLNLIKNASESMAGGGRVDIRTALSFKNVHGHNIPDGDGIEIVVADTGPGLPESIVKNLYKPFVTTKTTGHSGLGLSIVHKTVKDLGGSISCASSPQGTRFTIYLPLEKRLQVAEK